MNSIWLRVNNKSQQQMICHFHFFLNTSLLGRYILLFQCKLAAVQMLPWDFNCCYTGTPTSHLSMAFCFLESHVFLFLSSFLFCWSTPCKSLLSKGAQQEYFLGFGCLKMFISCIWLRARLSTKFQIGNKFHKKNI